MSEVTVVYANGGTVEVSVSSTPKVEVQSPEIRPVSVTVNAAPGPGVPTGGDEGAILRKNSGTDYDTGWTPYSFPAADGDDHQVLITDGAGTLTFDHVRSTRIAIRNDEGATIPAGTPVYSKGEVGNSESIRVGIADASDPSKMPAIGIAETTLNTTSAQDGYAIMSGVFNTNVSGFTGLSEGDILYVSNSGGGLSQTKPTGTYLIQNVGIVLKTNGIGTIMQGFQVSCIGRTNDIPNLAEGHIWIGDADGVPQATLFTSLDERDNFANANLTVTGDRTHNLATNDVNFVQSSGGTSTMYLDGNNARVGINTTTPGRPLHIAGTGPLVRIGNVEIDADGNFTSKALSSPSMAFKASDDTKITVQEASPGTITFDVLTGTGATETSTEVVRILGTTTAGRAYVGIGTANPYKKLHVSGGDALIQNDTSTNTFLDVKGTSANAYIRAYSGSNSVWLYQGGSISYLQAQSGSTMRVGSGTGNLIFSDTSGEVMRTSSGNVGIGVTSPAEKLEVLGNIRLNTVGNQLEFSNENVALQRGASNVLELGGYGGIAFKASAAAIDSQTERMRITDAGNVGIGTTSPVYKLDVNGDVNIPFGTSNGYRINGNRILSQGSGFFEFGALDYKSIYPNISTNNDGTFRIQSNGSTLVTVNQSGNVGIGTTSPSDKLHVVGDVRVEGDLTVNGSYTQVDTDVLTTEQWNVTNDGTGPAVTINQKGAQDIMDVQDDGVSVFYIEDGGNVGIGTTNPAKKLHVLNSTNEAQIRLGQSGSGSYDIGVYSGDTFSIGRDADTREFTLSGGNVGIGTTTPLQKLHLKDGTDVNLQIGAVSSELQLKATNDADSAYIPMILRASEFNILNGNVGIGTTAPSYKLHVDGGTIGSNLDSTGNNTSRQVNMTSANTTGMNTFTVYNTNTDVTPDFLGKYGYKFEGGTATANKHFQVYVSDASNPRLIVNGSGNVGIGTTTPSVNLELGTDGTAEQQLRLNSDVAGAYLRLESLGNVARMRATNGANLTIQSDGGSGYITNWAGGSERMRINYDGKVGIGTTTPNYLLDVEGAGAGARVYNTVGSTSVYLTTPAAQNASLYFGPSTDNDEGGITYRTASSSMAFTTNTSEAMRIDSSGKLGIGTTSPSQKLDVSGGDINLSLGNYIRFGGQLGIKKVNLGAMHFYAGTNSTTGGFDFATWNGSSYSEGAFVIRNSGNVGIGTTSPSYNLDVQGPTNGIIRAYGPSLGRLSLQNSTNHYSTSVQGGNWLFYDESAGAERMRIDSSGKVGIGTTSPADKLEVADGYIRVSGTGTSHGFKLERPAIDTYSLRLLDNGFTIYNDTDNRKEFLVQNGRVGIGTTSPYTELHVESNDAILTLEGSNASYVNAAVQLVSNHATNARGMGTFAYDASTDVEWFWGNPYSYNDAFVINRNTGYTVPSSQNSPPGIGASAGTLFKIASSGNVGIGTTSPTTPLHVAGVTQIAESGNTAFYGGNYVRLFNDQNFNIRDVGGSTVAKISVSGASYFNGGNVGIGTTSPTAKLHSMGADGSAFSLRLGRADTGSEWSFNHAGDDLRIYNQGGSGKDILFSVDAGGTEKGNKVGIGTALPTEKLTVSGNISVSGDVYSDGSIHADEIKGRTYPTHNILSLEDDNLPNQNGVSLSSVGSMAFHLDVNNNSSNDSFDWKADASPSGSATSLMRLTDEGNLGIGTTSPSAKLDVVGLANINDGSNNVMISSGNTAMTGASNTTVGYQAGRNNTSGINNSFVGYQAGYGNTTGGYNSFVGRGVGQSNTSGSNNSFVGYQAGYSNTIGSDNSFVGLYAGFNNTIGDNNSFFGRNAGYHSTGSANVVIGYGAGFGSATSAYSNTVAVGYEALTALTTGVNNTVIGYQAGHDITTAGYNTAVGLQALANATTNGYNTAIGVYALQDTTSSNAVAVGYGALQENTTGPSNTGVGYRALASNLTGGNNTAVGNTAGVNLTGGNNTVMGFSAGSDITGGSNTAIGWRAGEDVGSDNAMVGREAGRFTTGSNNVAIGSYAAEGVQATSTFSNTVAIGYQALTALTTGATNTAVGYKAGTNITIGSGNTAIGYEANHNGTSTDGNTAVGKSTLYNTTGSLNVAIGGGAAYGGGSASFSNTVAVGYQALYDLTNGASNTAVGYQAATNITTGGYNTALGYGALDGAAPADKGSNTALGYNTLGGNTTGSYNVAVGAGAGQGTVGWSNTIMGVNAANTTTGSNGVIIGFEASRFSSGSNNTVIGYEAAKGVSGSSTFSNTVAVGYQALYDLTSGAENTAIGYRASANTTTGDYNVSLGNYALYANQTGTNNTALGYGAAYATTSNHNTAVGFSAAYNGDQHNAALGSRALNYSTGSYNTAVGSGAAQGVSVSSTFSNTTAVGYQALYGLTTGANNTAVGYHAGLSNTSGSYNAFFGRNAGYGNTSGSNNSFVGVNAGYDNTIGNSNSFVGVNAGLSNTSGGSNSFVGSSAGRSNTIGSYNSFVGVSAGYNNTSGGSNSFFGRDAGYTNSTGSGNIFIGYQAGYNETGSNKLYIANSNTTTPLIYGDFNLGEITINGDLNVSGGNLKADAIEISGRAMTTPATGEYGSGSKLVTQFATGTVTAGKVYVANAGAWAEGDANAGSTSIGMIAVATDAASATEMLIEGVIKLSSNTGFSGAAAGTVLYLSTTAGELTTTAPSTAGEYVRVCGYVVNASTNEVFFSASRDWTEL